MKKQAAAYLRTSSATNVGADKDSDKRQLRAIRQYTRHAGIEITRTFYDEAVSGADHVDQRPGFHEMMTYLNENGVKTFLVETANRFARDLIVQETGFAMLQNQGIELIAVDSPDSFLEDTPTATLIRQVLGAVAQFDKAVTVGKLRAARDRKRASNGKCEGRKSYLESRPEVVALAKKLKWRSRKARDQRSLREISAELATAGHLTAKGQQFSASAVKAMLAG